MKRLYTAAILAWLILLITLPAVNAQDTKTKTLKASPGGRVEIEMAYGDVYIKTWERNDAEVKYQVDSEDDEYYEGVSISSSGGVIKITSNGSTDKIELTVPSAFNVDVQTGAGDVKCLGSLNGKLKIATAGGDISIKKVNGSVELQTSGGDIRADNIKGEVRISTYGGDLHLSDIEGSGRITTSGGDITLNNVSKSLQITTAGGNINVNSIAGTGKLSTGGGDININYVNGDADINTGGGNIKLNGVKGAVTTNTGSGNVYVYKANGTVRTNSGSGDVVVELLSNSGESHVNTNNGNVTLYIPDNLKITVEVRVSGVGSHYSYDENDFIKSQINPSSKTIDKRNDQVRAVYLYNGGGRKIYLNTSYGEVEIKRLK